MSPSEVFVRDNVRFFIDYILVKDRNRILCYYAIENKNLSKINKSSFKSSGGTLIDYPISMDYEDFKILKEVLKCG